MPELPDDYTDKFFQEGANQHDFTYNPDAWKAMEQMLDDDQKRRRVLPFFFYGLVGLAILGGIYVWSNNIQFAQLMQAVNVKNIQSTHLKESSDALLPTVDPTSHQKFALPEAHSEPEVEIVLEDSSVAGEDHSTSLLTVSTPSTKIEQTTSLNFSAPRESNRSTAHYSESLILKKGIEPTHDLIEQEINSNELKTNIYGGSMDKPSTLVADKGGALLSKPNVEAVKDQRRITEIDPVPLKPVKPAVISPLEEFVIANVKSSQSTGNQEGDLLSRISVRAQGGGVYGVTGQSSVGMARARYGVGFAFAVTDQIAFGSGANINNLCYITDGDGYRTKSLGWFGGASPSRIEAQCKVLEIPLEMTYFWKGNRESGFFFRGGMLNYLMLKEDYGFSYVDSEVPPNINVLSLRKEWKEVNTNQHFMGVAQLTLGYQFSLSPKTQLQVEGYVHSPLTGIGHGEVKVWSFGVNTSMNLNLK